MTAQGTQQRTTAEVDEYKSTARVIIQNYISIKTNHCLPIWYTKSKMIQHSSSEVFLNSMSKSNFCSVIPQVVKNRNL